MPEHLEIVLKKMFEYVDAEYSQEYVKKDGWYSEHSWSKEQEEEFRRWFIDYLYNNTKARKELYPILRKNKKDIQRAYQMFNLSYGWKTISQ